MARKPNIAYYRIDDEKRKIVENNYGWIIHVAKKIKNIIGDYIELEDLIQICAESFIKCLKQYDPSKSAITTYTHTRMVSEAFDFINNQMNKQRLKEISVENFIIEESDKYSILYSDEYIDNNIEEKVLSKVEVEKLLNKYKKYSSELEYEIVLTYLTEDLSQTELGKKFNLSRQRIHQYINYFRDFYKNKYKMVA